MIVEQLMITDKAALEGIEKKYILHVDDIIYRRWLQGSPLYFTTFSMDQSPDHKLEDNLREFIDLLDGNGFQVEYSSTACILYWQGMKAKKILEGPPPYRKWQYDNFGDYYRYWRKCQNDC